MNCFLFKRLAFVSSVHALVKIVSLPDWCLWCLPTWTSSALICFCPCCHESVSSVLLLVQHSLNSYSHYGPCQKPINVILISALIWHMYTYMISNTLIFFQLQHAITWKQEKIRNNNFFLFNHNIGTCKCSLKAACSFRKDRRDIFIS